MLYVRAIWVLFRVIVTAVRHKQNYPKNPSRGQELNLMFNLLRQSWADERGQDIAEYAVMLAVILVVSITAITLIGSNANNVFSSVASSIQ